MTPNMTLNELIQQLPAPEKSVIEVDLTDVVGQVFVYRTPDVLDIYASASSPDAETQWQLLSLRYRRVELTKETIITLELMARLHQSPAFEGDLRELYMQLLTQISPQAGLVWLQRVSDAFKPYLPSDAAVQEKKD